MNKQSSKSSQSKPSIVGTGLLALDVVINGNDYQLSRRWAGGTCGNVLIVLSFLEWDAYPVARLNGETASKRVLKDLKRWGVHLDFAKSEPRVDTPIIIHKIIRGDTGESVHKFSLKCPHCGSWLPTYRPVVASTAQRVAAVIESPQVFFLDRVSRGSLLLAKACSEKGALIVFEPSGIEDPKLFREALDLTHVLKYSKERMHDLRKWTRSVRPLLEIETSGQKGLRYRSQITSCGSAGWQRLESYRIRRVQDTAGAGDWCTAGVLHKLGQGGLARFQQTSATELRDALRFGQALAAWNCGFEGARGGMYEVDRNRFELEIAEIMSEYERSTSRFTGSELNPSEQVQTVQRPTSRAKIVRITTLAQAQDACCF